MRGPEHEPAPLTVGTAGHVDHGKTVLVRAITGVDTDRLEEEHRRGISIVLGYAPLELPSGRRLSLIDVPGHVRFIRTMVAGATGVDLSLMVVAADDGVMPQTREHAAILHALGVDVGAVAITKSDVADPARAAAQVAELLPGAPIVPVCAPTGEGIPALLAQLDALVPRLPGRPRAGAPARLHVDRVFTVRGAGTVVTGTLWEGSVARGDELTLLPAGRRARVRGVQVHDAALDVAAAGQRVALNLAGVARREVSRGDVVLGAGAPVAPAVALDVTIEPAAGAREPRKGDRVQVHHGTRESPARLQRLRDGGWRLHLERPLFATGGDRFVIRSIAPPDTLGGGTVARAWDREPAVRSARPRPAAAPPPPRASVAPPPGEPADAGAAVRIGRDLSYDPDELERIRRVVLAWFDAHETLTLAELRDELASSRKHAQALLEHFDRTRLTLRLPDDRRRLRRRRPAAGTPEPPAERTP